MNRHEHECKCKICDSVMNCLGHKEPWNVDSYICRTCGTLLEENECRDVWEDRDGNDLDNEEIWKSWIDKLAVISRLETRLKRDKFKMSANQLRQVIALLDSM